MAWTPPAEEEKKPTGTSWTPPENEVKWTPPAEDDPENPVNEKEPWRLKKLKESGVPLSEEQEKLLWKYEEDRPLLDKAGEAVRTFFPAAAKVANQLGTGSVDLIYKGVLKPIDAMSQTPEEAKKTLKEAGNAWRSLGSGAMSDMEETIDMATRFSMFGSGITDKLQGLPEEERFKRFKNREVMRQLGQAVREEMPDRAAALISENPFLKKAAGAYAKLAGGTPEEVKMAEEAFTELVKESGLTKEELDENISMLGEFMSPVALPGANRITGAIAKPVGKVVQKTGELALRGIKPIAGAVEGAAELTLKGTELVQGGARKIGEYTTNDPDTLLRTGANTVVMPINAVAKPTSNVARVVKDVTSQVDVGGAAGRRGLFERAGRAGTSSDLTRRLFGPQGKGGVARAKVADWTVRQANAIIQPGVNGAALNVLMGLPDIETAAQFGEVAGTGFGIGGFAGARVFDRAGAIIDPTTSLAEKITTVVTPDMAQRRRDEDADIKRFIATATPEMKSQMADLSNIDKRKTAIDSKLINLRQQKERTINAADEANLQRQIDGVEKQRQALEKATPQTVREAERQVQLAFVDAMDLAQATGTAAGLRGLNLTVLDADNAEGFFRNLYGGAVERAEGVVDLLTGRTDLTMQESQNLQQARELLNRFSTEVAGAKNQRGFAIGVDGTDPNAEGYVPPHLRKVNQTGATAVINGDLVKHLSEQGFDVRRVINHEMQHALQQFREVKDMLSPIRGDLFDQKVVKDDGTVEVWKEGIFSDADIARYGANYAAKMSPADNGASFIAQFQDVDAFTAYIKDEILAEVASQTGDYSNGTRAALDDVGRNLVDWLEVKTKAGALRKMKEGLRTFGIVFDNYGGYSNVLGADLPPEALAMIRQYQRQLRDFDGSMQIQTTREEDAPDIPMTAILGSRALQEKYKDADFFEKEQILRSTAPDGTVTEIVMPKGAKLDPFVDIYRIQGGQLVDANGNPVQLPPEITFGSLPEGSTFQMDTRIARKPDGSPITLSAREIKSRALERTQSIRNVIDSAPDDGTPNRLIDTGNGNYRGVMSPSQLAAVLSIPNNVLAPALKRQIQFFNELMQRGDGTRAIFEYQAALLNGKYKAIAPKIRDEVPIGWQFTKDGNFALTTMSVSRLYDKLQAWADQGTVTQEQTWTGELIPVKRSKNLALWNGDTNKFWNSLVQVLDNHANGREGWVGLHSDELTAKRMRNKVNDLFNVFNKETKEMNPDRSTLPRVRGRDNVDIIVRSRRVDRINSFSESPSTKVPVNYGKLLINYMPETNPLAAPQTPEQFMENINGSVSATRIRNAIATGAVDQLESELRNSDDLLPTESLFVSQGEGGDPLIQVTSMLDPNVEGALEPEEVVVDLDAQTAAELARLEAEEAAAMAAQQQAQAPVEPAPAPEPAPEPAPAPTTQFMPAEAPSGERGFQSKLQLEIQKKFKGASATPEQLKAVLGNPQNVKPEEVKWSGVMDEIDRLAQENNGKVPVQELMNYLRDEGQVKFKEVTIGHDNEIQRIADQYRIKIEEWGFYGKAFYDEFDEPLELDEVPPQLLDAIYKAGKKPEPRYAQYQLPGGTNYREVVLSMPSNLSRSQAKIDAINKRRKDILNIAKEQDLFKRSQTDPEAKALNDSLTAEFVELGKQADQLNADIRDGKTGEQFTSSHFPDVPNYIAHMRLNEREALKPIRSIDEIEKSILEAVPSAKSAKSLGSGAPISALNKGLITQEEADAYAEYRGYTGFGRSHKSPGLFIEELQSDRHQQGRESGYIGEREIPEGYELIDENQSAREEGYNVPSDAPPRWRFKSSDTFSKIYDSRQAAIDAAWKDDSYSGESRIPDAPFRKDWGVQLFKRALRDAVESGKSWIGWTTGDTQAERYDLSKQVDEVSVYQSRDRKGQFFISVRPKGSTGIGMQEVAEGISYDKIQDYLGKELAEKVNPDEFGQQNFSDIDLKVGGEGMKGFYDQILPKDIGKYVAKMGGKVEKSEVQIRPKREVESPIGLDDEPLVKMDAEYVPMWQVNITPEMENVVRAGQIQFMPAESDAEYLRLAQDPEANQEQLQRMVDNQAISQGIEITYPLFRGVRRNPKNGVMYTQGERATLSFTDVPEVAKLYTHNQEFGGITPSPYGSVKKVYLNIKKPLDIRDEGTKVNLGNFIDKYFNWDWKSEDYITEDNVFSGDDLVRLLNRMSKLEAKTNFESDIQSSDPGGIFRHRNFSEVANSIREILYTSENESDTVEQIENILSSIDLDTYALADNKWVIKHLKDQGYDGLIHKDTIEAGKEFFQEESVAGKDIEEIKGINADDDYSHDTWRPFNKEQIKLSDPVTYDNEGNVIPLSQRFQTTSPDIRFMPEEQGPLADIQAPEQRGEQKVLAEIEPVSDVPKLPKKYAYGYTTSSDRIKLVSDLAKSKNWNAIRDLNQATIRHAMSDLPGVKYTIKDVLGAFEDEREVSALPEFEINTPEELAAVRKRMVSLAELWDQTEVLEEEVGAGNELLLGTVDNDGYLHTGKYALTFDKLTPSMVEKARKAAGIQSMTIDGNTVIFYDTNNNPAEFERKVDRFGEFITENGGVLAGSEANIAKIRSYRNPQSPKAGSLYYNEDPVRLFGAGEAPDRLRTKVYRVVSELLGRPLPPPKDGRSSYFVKDDVTPKQVKLQNNIAKKQDAVVLNDKGNKDVVKAYEELNKELLKQYDALIDAGMEFYAAPDYETYEKTYKSSADVIADIRNNNKLVYLQTNPATFGPQKNGKPLDFSFHPLLKNSGRKNKNGNEMNYNDILRVVHDAIAHGIYSAQFGPVGEESAWHTHIRTIDNPWARWALTMETRAQNSWVNYQDKFLNKEKMPKKPGDEGYIPIKQREYAMQKFALVPLKFALTGEAKVDKPVLELIEQIGPKRAEGSKERRADWMPSKQKEKEILSKVAQPPGDPKKLFADANSFLGKPTKKDGAESTPVIVAKEWFEKKTDQNDGEEGEEAGETITVGKAELKDVVLFSQTTMPLVVQPLPNYFAENNATKVSKNVLAIAKNPTVYKAYTDRVVAAGEKIKNDPQRFVTLSGYLEFMRESGASGNLLMPPSQLAEFVKKPQYVLDLWNGGYHGKKTIPGTIAAAKAGLDSVNEMRDLFIVDGKNLGPTPMITALHHLWGILSRQLDPLNQEGMWMRLVSDPAVIEQIQLSIDGKFTLSQEEWQKVVQNARKATKGEYSKIGNNATSNANAFHHMLKKHNGKWNELASIYTLNDAVKMTNAFWGLNVGATGIKNKVQRFIGLTFGIHGSVLDRWRFVSLNLPMAMKLRGAQTPESYFKYYGKNKTIPEDPVGIYKSYGTVENGNLVFSTALYAGIDKVIEGMIANSPEMRDFLGVHATAGGFHWIDWNCVKNEAVGHSSLDLTKEFLKRKGRKASAEDFLDVVKNTTVYTRADQDGKIFDLVMENGIFRVREE